MQISRDVQQEEVVINRLIKRLSGGNRDQEEHVSDAIYCPRKPILKVIDPQPMTRQQAAIFLVGRGHHEILQSLSDGQAEVRILREQLDDGGTLLGTMDLVEAPIGIIEIKSTRTSMRSFDAPDGVMKKGAHYVHQLRSYCAIKFMAWTPEDPHPQEYYQDCYLLALFIMGSYKKDPDIRVWKIHFNAAELEDWAATLDERAEIMRADRRQFAKLKGNPEAIKAAIAAGEFPNDAPRFSWECSHCEWARLCWPKGIPKDLASDA